MKPLNSNDDNMLNETEQAGSRLSMLTADYMPDELKEWVAGEENSQIFIDYEDAEKLNYLTVINDDGTKTTRIFNRPVKYIEDNKIKFIDNALKKSYKVKSLFTTYEYENSQSDVKLYLPAKIKDGLLMQSENMALRLTPVNSSEAKVRLKEFTFAGDTQSVAEYPNAFGEGAHLQYAAISGGFKENILLDSYIGNVFEFKLSIPGHYAILSDRGVKVNIYSYAEPDGGPKYVISQPYALDSYQGEPDGKAHVGFDNRYELVQTADSEYILRMIIDKEFLTSEDTVYPVLIDPTVAYASSGSIEDTYVCEANGIKYNNDSLLRLGADSNPLYGRMSIYAKNTFMWYFRYIRPENIVSAKYKTRRVGTATASGMNVSVYDCTIAHAVNQVTYSQLENSTGAFQSSAVLDMAHTLCEFNVTSLTKQWLKNLLNEGGKSYSYGFIIKAASGTNGYMCLRAADDPAGNYPCFEITYNEDTSVNDGTYYIRNKQSGQYLDVYNLGTAPGTSIIQFPFNGGDNQMWQITYQNNGLYTICPKHAPSMYLQVSGGTNVDNSQVIQGAYNPQYPYYNWWRLIKNANGTYRLIPYISTILALDNNGSGANSANILIGDYYGYAYQQWELVPTEYQYGNYLYSSIISSPSVPEEKITALQNIENEYDVWPAGNLSIYKDLSDTERMNTINALVDKAELFLLMGPITPDAAEYLEHFLDKTGTAVTVNFDRIINQSNEASEGRLNDMTRAMYVVERMGEKLPVGCNFTVCSVNDASHYITSGNWHYAIGHYSTKVQFDVTKTAVNSYSAEVNYYFYDVYDWARDDDKKMAGIISPQELWEIQYAGEGKGYYVFGVDYLSMEWSVGDGWYDAEINDPKDLSW